ncbi:GAD-like domain-containing protein [Pseudomonas juntendi]|uniref:GAD-like domain-containing protein n=1 Tax=Pseudomonas juntendi TaxID=2666183 RepID=UPI0034D543B6
MPPPGIFWLVNPQEYDAVVSCWIAGTAFDSHDNYHLIARSAFGDLYLWGEKTGFSLEIASLSSQYVFYKTDFTKEQLNSELQGFILSRKVDSNDFNDLFNPAREKLGRLKHDEMYGFFPALMLGGSDSLQHLQKVSAIEHLVFLAQLADLQPYPFSEQPD